MNIIFLYDHLPHSNASYGGVIYVYNFIKYFSQKHKIYLICLAEQDSLIYTSEIRNYCEVLVIFPKKKESSIKNIVNYFFKFFAKAPFFIEKNFNQNLNNEFNRVLKGYKIDFICCERISMYTYIRKNRNLVKNIKIYLREDTLLYYELQRNILSNLKELIFSFKNIKGKGSFKEFTQISILNVSNFLISLQFKKVKKYQIKAWNDIDYLTATNEVEKSLIQLDYKKNVNIMPNVIDYSTLNKSNKYREKFSLLFLGNYAYSPNRDGIIFFLKKIYPKLISHNDRIILYIIGPNPTKKMLSFQNRNPKNIKILGWVEDPFEYLNSKSIFIAPLYSGGGQRIKLLYALAAKIPIITTRLCINEFHKKPVIGKEILIANNPLDFITKIKDLLYNSILGRMIGENGYQFLLKNYNWKLTFQGLERDLLELTLRNNS